MALQTYFTTKIHHSFSPILTVRSKKSSGPSKENSKRKQKRQREGASKIRRNPIEKPALMKEQEPVQPEPEQRASIISRNPVEKPAPEQRASIIRRKPVEKSALVKEQEPVQQEQGAYENAFILAWLGFGSVILVEGLALAASGFVPEEWDKIFVKYLYPSFTPTVFLFVAGAIAFGVVKYKQNEKLTERK